MNSTSVKCFLYLSGIVFLFVMAIGIPPALSGTLRITMADGTFVDAPYFWEEEGQVKFDIPGGVAGIPKEQVISIQEVLDARAFDPEVIATNRSGSGPSPNDSQLHDLISNQIPSNSAGEKLGAEEGSRLIQEGNLKKKTSNELGDRTYGPVFKQRGDFSELVRVQGNQVVLVMRNVLSSPANLNNYKFLVVLYDSEGNILQRKPCEVSELKIDQGQLKKLGIREKFYSVAATVSPDSKIARYELTAVKQ